MRRRTELDDPYALYLELHNGSTPQEVREKDPTLYHKLHKAGLTEKLPRKDGKLLKEVRDRLDVFFTKEGYKDPNFLLPQIRFRTARDGKKHICTLYINGHRHAIKPGFGLPYTDIGLGQTYFDDGWILGAYSINENGENLIKEWEVNPNGRHLLLPRREKPYGLRKLLTNFMNREFQLEPIYAKSDKWKSVELCSFSLNGRNYRARVYIGKPNTDVQIKDAYFHEQYGCLIGVYEKNKTPRGELLRVCRVDEVKYDCLQPVRTDEFFSVNQTVKDRNHGIGKVTDVEDRVKVYFEHPTVLGFDGKPYIANHLIVYYPLDTALRNLSIV